MNEEEISTQMDNVNENPEEQPEEKKEVGEEVQNNTISEDDIKKWAETGALEKQADKKREKVEQKFKDVALTRDDLLARAQKPYPIKVAIDKDEEGAIIRTTFQVRRLTPRESADLRIVPKDPKNLTNEEIQALDDLDFKIMEKCIIEPKGMDFDTLKNLDGTLVDDLKRQISILNSFTNDAEVVETLKNLSISPVNSNSTG
jgi:uncharacterized membrane protein YheB (UPF0754 family)